MKFIYAVLLAAATATASALPERLEARVCGSPMCSNYVALGAADCPLDCMWGDCTKYQCITEGYDVICGKNGDSCAKA
ncbi:hypothetical protein BDV36DRAFT_290212 [Aspergillus pseudocaelatus]|uniref:Uncharacterized protein n=1 Tax=Aspergillus pseudocaelatus TaxID=1825620 RepID=A0ABQ6X3W1_9EURO|nr:hypothetical protein BDV36DRAFT_290212 [Aspergillus pseudocaelatus]